MYFTLSVLIHRPVPVVFAFFRDKDKLTQEKDSAVIVIEKMSEGSVGRGTCYREVLQMMPFYREEIRSEITRYESEKLIEERFKSRMMYGRLIYLFTAEENQTRLTQQEELSMRGLLIPFQPIIQRTFLQKLQSRLDEIKKILEAGWTAL